MKNILHIYCDLDGVLVDFNKGYYDLTGYDMNGQYRTDSNFYEPINNAGYSFWINLDWKKDGKELWNYIEKYTPILLSAPTKKNDSRVGKMDWVKRELPGTKLILRSSGNKKEFASPTSILIDDLSSNIEQWINAGGIGILHTSTESSIKKLKKLDL
ncbi:MAG: hypothetical protein WC755_09600 [Candidatus Woesearchaeota archaeon]|jgi:hypothetical protein